jgi:hypothetical protein
MKKQITEKENVSLSNRKDGKTMNYNKMTKAQLIEMIKQKENSKKGFNIWNYTFKNIVDSYIKSGEQTSFKFNVKRIYDSEFTNDKGENVKLEGSQKVLAYLNKLGALKVVKYSETFTEDGKHLYEVEIKDFNINVEREGKNGKYKLFANYYGNLKLAS